MKIKTCFSKKPLGHFQPNFVYKEMKIHIHNAGHMNKMAAMPIYGKNLLKSSFQEIMGLFRRNLV